MGPDQFSLPQEGRVTPQEFWDPRWFTKFLTIRTKTDGLQPFMLNNQQLLMAAAYIDALRQQKWLVHVKPRQEGSSTFFAACVFQHVMFRQGIRASIIAHKTDTAKSLAKMVNLAYAKFPRAYRPVSDSRVKSRLVLPDPHFSELAVSSVQADDPERGETTQVMLATEISSWAESKSSNAWTSARNAVPAEGGLLIAESTPKYEGDPLQKVWQEGEDGRESPWVRLFISWIQVDEYRMTPPHRWEPTGDVLYYAQQHPFIANMRDRLYWMACVGLPKCDNNLSKFMAEFPLTDIDCWQAAGECIFDKLKLKAQLNWLGPVETVVPGVPDGYPLVGRDGVVAYRPAIAGHPHLIVVDPASSFGTRDLFGAVIVDIVTWETVVDFLGYRTAGEMADMVVRWRQEYPVAVRPTGSIVVGAEGVGEAVINALLDRGVTSRNGLYYALRNKTEMKPGFYATGPKKTESVSLLQEAIVDGADPILSRRVIKQLLAYRNGWTRDAQGGHFELVACMAMACWWLKYNAAAATRVKPVAPVQPMNLLMKVLRAAGGSERGVETPWGKHL